MTTEEKINILCRELNTLRIMVKDLENEDYNQKERMKKYILDIRSFRICWLFTILALMISQFCYFQSELKELRYLRLLHS
jgi:hypothetical protein